MKVMNDHEVIFFNIILLVRNIATSLLYCVYWWSNFVFSKLQLVKMHNYTYYWNFVWSFIILLPHFSQFLEEMASAIRSCVRAVKQIFDHESFYHLYCSSERSSLRFRFHTSTLYNGKRNLQLFIVFYIILNKVSLMMN